MAITLRDKIQIAMGNLEGLSGDEGDFYNDEQLAYIAGLYAVDASNPTKDEVNRIAAEVCFSVANYHADTNPDRSKRYRERGTYLRNISRSLTQFAEDIVTPASGQNPSGGGNTPGIASVVTNSTLTGNGTTDNPLGVENPFTAADEAKLAGIESGAQVNPARAGAFTAADETKLDNLKNLDTAEIIRVVYGTPTDGQQIRYDNTNTRFEFFTAPTIPARAGAFTAADEAKLDGIESGAEVNPPHTVSFSALAGSSADADGQIFFENALGNEIQSGNLLDASYVTVADYNASYTASNLGSPGTQLDAVNVQPFFNDHTDKDGIFVIHILVGSQTGFLRIASVAEVSGGYRCRISDMSGTVNVSGTGQTIRVRASDDLIVFPNEILDQPWPTKQELAGSETDRYASYTNSFLAGLADGFICLFTGTTAPTDARAIGQPDIATGSGVIAFTRLRKDADPNNFQLAEALSVSDYPIGKLLHLSLDRDKGSYLAVTLTATPTLVTSGSTNYLWGTASWVETGNIANVTTAGNYFKISEYIPTDLRLRIPARDITGAYWVDGDGSNVTDKLREVIQGRNEDEILENFTRVASGLASGGDNRYSISGNTITFSVAADSGYEDEDSITNDAKFHRAGIERAWIAIGAWIVQIESVNARYISQGRAQYLVTYDTIEGTAPALAAVSPVEIIGEDVHRGQLAKVAFRNNTPNIGGTGASNPVQFWREDGTWATVPTQVGQDLPELASVTNVGTSWTDIISATEYAGLSDNSWVLVIVQATGDNTKTDVGAFKKSQLSATAKWFASWPVSNNDNYRSGARLQFKLDGTGSSTKVQAQRQGPFGSTSLVTLIRLQGPKGDTGNTGATGATGAEGPAGAQGIQGNDGADGTDGRNPYRGIWTASTSYLVGDIVTRSSSDSTLFSCITANSDSSFTASKWQTLKGAQGIQGIQGNTGPAGTNGTNGTDGTDGTDGRSPYRGIWTANTSYLVGDIVTRSSNVATLYSCITANSDANFSSSKWNTLKGATGPAGTDGTDGSDANVTSANIVSAVHGTPTDGQVISYDNDNSRLEFTTPSSSGGGANIVAAEITSGYATNSLADAGLSVTITPSTTSKKILLECIGGFYIQGLSHDLILVQITKSDNTVITKGDYGIGNTSTGEGTISIAGIDSPASTSAQTYKVRWQKWVSANTLGAAPTESLVLKATEID